MAVNHLLYTPENVSKSMLAALINRSTLARIVNQDYSKDFLPGKGASVDVLRPVMIEDSRVYTKEDRLAENAITYSELFQPYTSVKIADQVYNAIKLPDDFTTFTLADVQTQVIAPMAESVADGINRIVANTFNKVEEGLSVIDRAAKGTYVDENGVSYPTVGELKAADAGFIGRGLGLQPVAAGSPVKNADLTADTNADVLKAIRAAHRLFGIRGVPVQNRYLVVGSGWAGALMSQSVLNKANEAATDGLLRDATLGRIYGFTVIEDYTIDPYAAYALNRDAITLATRVTATPLGAGFAATAAAGGFTARFIRDYDADHLQDRAVMDTFAGAQILDRQRIVKLVGAPGIEEPVAPTTAVTEPVTV